MKKYVAFLRGINISGKNKISMLKLKQELENADFMEVTTYLNSGNIVFSTEKINVPAVIEKIIKDRFNLEIPVYVIEIERLQKILSAAPHWWGQNDGKNYDNLIFILTSDTAESIRSTIGEPSKDLEKIQIYENVIFWTFDRKLYQKCNWWKKTATKGIAEKLTIRTANTIQKMCVK